MAIQDMLLSKPFLISSAVTFLILAWLRKRSVEGRVTPIHTEDPLWLEALAKARASLDEMRKLYATSGIEVFVKYPLVTTAHETEHVWGKVLKLTDTEMEVTLETTPVTGAPKSKSPLHPLASLEDWQVRLPDGRIRGGFSSQAQIQIARRDGHRVPAPLAEAESLFVDRLSSPP